MADAITELRRLRDVAVRCIENTHECYRQPWVRMRDEVNASLTALEAAQQAPLPRRECRIKANDPIGDREAQQAEPSDAEIEAWRNEALRVADDEDEGGSPYVYRVTDDEIEEAVALMRRGRGDAKLREAARNLLDDLHSITRTTYSGEHIAPDAPLLQALRAALGES